MAKSLLLILCAGLVGVLKLWWPCFWIGYGGGLVLIHRKRHGKIEWPRFVCENWFWILVAPALLVCACVLLLVVFAGGSGGNESFKYEVF